MQNWFLIVLFACLFYLIYNLILYKKHSKQILLHKINSKINLLFYGIILLLILAFQFLNIYNFISDDFSYNAVYKHSEQSILWIYKITSSFSNKSGAFLLWLTCIASVGFAFTKEVNKKLEQNRLVYLLQSVSIVMPLLLTIMLFFTDAFAQTTAIVVPSDGIGFKPILYNKYNLFHAPLLFAGLTFYYYMYVLVICSILNKKDLHDKFNDLCTNLLDKYNKLGLLLLFSGTLLGSLWAYNSFGWGGFWNWDPIENAALIPLLLSFALLFTFNLFGSIRPQKLFKLILLIPLIIFPMILLCTFLARGGASLTKAIQSIHSYAETNNIELIFILGVLLLVLIISILLFIIKIYYVANNKADSFKFKFNFNTIAVLKIITLLCMGFVVLIGTCLPLFAGLFGFTISMISTRFYIVWHIPLVSIFFILSSITTLASDDKFQQVKFSSKVIFTLIFALISTVFAYLNNISQATTLFLVFACSLTFAAHLWALLQRTSLVGITLVHIGIAIFVLAALLQSHYTVQEKIILPEKQQVETKFGITCTFHEIKEEKLSNSNIKVTASMRVLAQNAELELAPHFIVSKNNIISYHFPDYTRSGITDIYIQPLACYEHSDGNMILIADIIVKPWMVFVWVGGVIIICGLAISIVHTKKYQSQYDVVF